MEPDVFSSRFPIPISTRCSSTLKAHQKTAFEQPKSEAEHRTHGRVECATRTMRQAFVPATTGAENDACAKKRRRPVAPGEGEAVSSIYESIVRPGKSSTGGSGSESNRWVESNSLADAGYLAGSRASPMALPAPPPSALESGKTSTGKRRARPAPSPLRPTEFGPAPNPDADLADTDEEREEGLFCRVCGVRVKSLSEEKHATSTLHIFNQKHRPQDRKVQIHESNKGFQLLAGMGWKLDEGLGARKQGRVNPLQTTFKRDTTGLGAGDKLRPRVTHFPSHVPSQALNARDGKSEAVRAHESLDRRRGRRHRDEAGKRRDQGVSDGSGASKESVSRGGVRAGVCSGGRDSVDAWGGFWGQGTQPEVDRFSGGGAVGGGSSSGRRVDGERGVYGGGGGGGGKYGTGFFMSKKEREAEKEREMRKARKARFELLSDVPEEYAALFMG